MVAVRGAFSVRASIRRRGPASGSGNERAAHTLKGACTWKPETEVHLYLKMPGRRVAPVVRLNVETEPAIPGLDDVLRERLVVFARMRKRNVRGSSGCRLDNQIPRIARIRSDTE